MFATKSKTYQVSILLTILLVIALSANLSLLLHFELHTLNDNQHFLVGSTTAIIAILLIASLSILTWRQNKQLKDRECILKEIGADNSFFRLLSEKSNDMIHLNDTTGKILYANPITSSFLGYELDEMINRPAGRFIHPDHRESVQADMAKVMQGENIPAREITLVTKNGDPLEVEVKGFSFHAADQTQYIGAILRDVGSRKENEQLSKLQDEWEETFNTISDFISIHDKDFKVIKANNALCDFLGKPPEQIIGKPCYQLFHDRTEPIDECPHVKASKTGHPVSIEIKDTHLGIPIQITCSPFFYKEGAFRGSVHLARTVGDPALPPPHKAKTDFVTVCASCKSIRDSQGKWRGIEEYLPSFNGSQCTHSICQRCQQKLYPQFTD